jgi:predicted ArsR family transcriptional regulator
MSREERDELDWLKRPTDGSITQREAAERIGVTDRWVRKLLKRMAKQGDAVVVHGLRGRPSNRKLPTKTQRQALAILKQPEWHDFGRPPTSWPSVIRFRWGKRPCVGV